MTAADRVDDLRARRAAMAADRAAFEERRHHGLAARHRAKLAHLAARAAKETTEQQPPRQPPAPAPEPDAA